MTEVWQDAEAVEFHKNSEHFVKLGELNQFDVIFFGGGDAAILLGELNRTGLSDKQKQAIENGPVNLSDGQTILIKGEQKTIIS